MAYVTTDQPEFLANITPLFDAANQQQKAAQSRRLHVGVTYLKNIGADFLRVADDRVRPQGMSPYGHIRARTTLFSHHHPNGPEDEFDLFKKVHETVGLDALVILSGESGNAYVAPMTKAMKDLKPDLKIIYAGSDHRDLKIGSSTISTEDAKELVRAVPLNYVASAKGALSMLWNTSCERDLPEELQQINMQLPEGIDAICSERFYALGRGQFRAIMGLPQYNHDDPEDFAPIDINAYQELESIFRLELQ